MEKLQQYIDDNKLDISIQNLSDASIARLMFLINAAEAIKAKGFTSPRVNLNDNIEDEDERVSAATVRGFKNATLLSYADKVSNFNNENKTEYRPASFSFLDVAGNKATGGGIIIEKNLTDENTGETKMHVKEDYLVQFQFSFTASGKLDGNPSAVVTALKGGGQITASALLGDDMDFGTIETVAAQQETVRTR